MTERERLGRLLSRMVLGQDDLNIAAAVWNMSLEHQQERWMVAAEAVKAAVLADQAEYVGLLERLADVRAEWTDLPDTVEACLANIGILKRTEGALTAIRAHPRWQQRARRGDPSPD